VAIRRSDGAGTPLLLANGIGASLELLQPFVDALDPGVEVIRFDVPGVGGSPPPAFPYRFSGLSRLVARMLTILGYGTVDVLGVSWGGGLAQDFALTQRRRCRRLVLVATATGSVMLPAHARVLLRMVTPRRYLDATYAATIAPEVYGGSAREHPEEVAHLLHHSRVGSRKGYYLQLLAGAGWTSLPFLPLLRQPALILCGDDDPLIHPINGHVMRWLMPRARLTVYRGGHLALITEANVLAPVIDSFLMSDGPLRNAPDRSHR
jgi:poly(3-hydroxyalkanoate) depolymerase